MILAYETATNVCSVSFQDGDGKIFEKRIQGRGVHSDNVFLFTQKFMQEHDFRISDLDAVLVSNGPGSYTGLRIAVSAIKGLLFETEIPLYAANTLASFAMESGHRTGVIHAVIDARRTHVYHQAFKLGNKLKAISDPKILEISELESQINPGDCVIGTGITRFNQELLEEIVVCDDRRITANSLLKLYKLSNFKEYCLKTKSEELNPNYISSSQVNNS